MSTMSNILLDKEILLESGTNELEVLVFDVADYTFGINVAKVREVLLTTTITGLPRAHSSIRGVFKLRDNVIPCVSLLDHLGIESTRENSESNMILSDFNQQQTAFLVDDVERIHRLSWENILAVPDLDALAQTPITALARCGDRLIVMLDFEKILDDVTEQYFRTDTIENPLGLPRENLRILLAEDSPTVREAIGSALRNSGYTQLSFFNNGDEAWQWISQRLSETGNVADICDLVISDIEMPQVDGFHLTKRIKEHPELKQLPVLLYSSIVTPDNHKKGLAVGADAQVSKPELGEVVRLADELISTAKREHRAAALRQVTRSAMHAEATLATKGKATASARPASAPTTPTTPISTTPAPTATGSAKAGSTEPATSPSVSTSASVPSPPDKAMPVQEFPSEEWPAPQGVDTRLWHTFHRELTGRVAELRQWIGRSRSGDRGDEVFRGFGRTLHTIKSASMVIPLEPITRCTHLMESLMERAKGDLEKWPQDGLENYTHWLESLLSPPATIDAALATGRELEAELGG